MRGNILNIIWAAKNLEMAVKAPLPVFFSEGAFASFFLATFGNFSRKVDQNGIKSDFENRFPKFSKNCSIFSEK